MPDFTAVFAPLRELLAPYATVLDVKRDEPTELYLDTRHLQKNRTPLFFGAVQVKKAYVSFHLMPVYLEPALLDGISPALKARMQGRSCFNFATPDAALFDELAALTEAGYARFQALGWVPSRRT